MALIESNSELEMKVKTLESQLHQLQQQISQGIIPQANAGAQEQPKRQRQKSNSGVKVSSGRIQEILKTATKTDIQTIKSHMGYYFATTSKITCCIIK